MASFGGDNAQHYVANLVIAPNVDPDEADLRFRSITQRASAGTTQRLAVEGQYDCQVRRISGQWQFTRFQYSRINLQHL